MQSLYSAGIRLSLGIIDLSGYRNKALDSTVLNTIRTKLALAQTAGIKWVILPVYNYSAGGQDAPKSIILGHISQLGPVFDDYDHVIAYHKLGFVGEWGEHHDSSNGIVTGSNNYTTDFKDIFDAAVAAYTKAKFIGVRYPKHAHAMNWPAKCAIFNDCQLSNNTDTGTFTGLSDPLRAETGTMCDTRPYGGETCNFNDNNARRTSTQAISDFKLYNAAYLNQEYDKSFIAQWKSDGGYNTIFSYLGYRIQLDQISHQASASKGSTLVLSVYARNVGYSRIFQTRPIIATLKHKSTGALITAAGTDLATLPAQATASTLLSINVLIPSGAAAGEYDVLLSAPDAHSEIASDARFAVRWANSDSGAQAWDGTTARFKVGTTVTVA